MQLTKKCFIEPSSSQLIYCIFLSSTSVLKPRVGEAGGQQTRHYHRCRPPTVWLWKWVSEKWSEVIRFWSFDFYETFICYRGCLNLNCYIGKKVQKNFLMGLKIWWSWGSGKKISKTQQVGDFSKIDPQLDDYQWWFWVKFWGFDKILQSILITKLQSFPHQYLICLKILNNFGFLFSDCSNLVIDITPILLYCVLAIGVSLFFLGLYMIYNIFISKFQENQKTFFESLHSLHFTHSQPDGRKSIVGKGARLKHGWLGHSTCRTSRVCFPFPSLSLSSFFLFLFLFLLLFLFFFLVPPTPTLDRDWE